MDSAKFKKIEEIFHAALAIAPMGRAAFLDAACDDDAELRNEIELMLSFEVSQDNLIDKHPEELAAEVFAEPPPSHTKVPRQIGRFKIHRILGEGGMGTVYLAEDERLARKVAIKTLRMDVIVNQNLVQRFKHEARSASALNHPNILTVFEIDEFRTANSEIIHYIATEFIDGETFHELIYSPKTSVERLLQCLEQVAAGLIKAHSAGIVHRDLKPENIMVTKDGFAKILDFGLAKLTDAENGLHSLKEHKSRSGVILGTLGYMSPEQALGLADVDERSDIFSFGCLLYEAVAKRRAFQAETTVDALYKIIHHDPVPIGELVPGISSELRLLIEKCLKKDRTARFRSIAEVAAALHKLPSENLDKTLRIVLKQTDLNDPKSTVPHQFSSQRRQITVIFADFSALAEFFEDLDPEESSRILKNFWSFIDSIVERGGGKIGERLTDTFISTWGTEKILETDPENAVRTALRLQAETLEYFNKTITGEIDLSEHDMASLVQIGFLKIGISTGHVLLGNSGSSESLLTGGPAVGIAKRLMTSAPGGEIYVSQDCYRHIRGVFDVEEVKSAGEGSLKTKRAATKTFSIKSVKPRSFRRESRGVEGIETPIIGRDGELSKLSGVLQEVEESGNLQSVTIVGEAGLGKSRLLFEFEDAIEVLPTRLSLFKARAQESMRGLPFSLIRDLFSFYSDILESDSQAVARGKLVAGITRLTAGTANSFNADGQTELKAHFIGQLIGFDFSESEYLKAILDDEKQVQQRAMRYAAQFFGAVAAIAPLIIYFDDLHWADESSLDFIGQLEEACADRPIMIVETARPSLFEHRPHWGEGNENKSRIVLQSLSKNESRKLTANILEKAGEIPDELQNLIVANSNGNPFYVEELIKMFIESDVIKAGADVWEIDAGKLGQISVPPTLAGVLESRLDRLTYWEKRVLQRASVIGREFWDVAFRSFEKEIDVSVVLESLRAKELLFRKERSSLGDSSEYLFKHALLRDVTYQTVLLDERRNWHSETAAWLVETSGERENEYLSVIAEHYEKAKEHPNAALWYGRAGQQALSSYAIDAAESHFRKAIGYFKIVAVEELATEQLIDALGGLGRTMHLQAKFAESIEFFEEMLTTAETYGKPTQSAEACAGLTVSMFDNGRIRESIEVADRVIQLTNGSAPKSRERVLLAKGLYRKGRALLAIGEYHEAIAFGERTLEATETFGEEQLAAHANAYHLLSFSNMFLANFEKSEVFETKGIEISRSIGDRRSLGNGLNNLGINYMMRGNAERAIAYFREALEYSTETGNKPGRFLNLGNIAGAMILLGDYERAETQLRQVIEEWGDRGHFAFGEFYRLLAESLIGQRRLADALAAAETALGFSEESSSPEMIGEAWRIFGVIAAFAGSAVAVKGVKRDTEACFGKSLEVFVKNEMWANYAQTLHNLAHFESTRGNNAKTAELLAKVAEISDRLKINTENKSPYLKPQPGDEKGFSLSIGR